MRLSWRIVDVVVLLLTVSGCSAAKETIVVQTVIVPQTVVVKETVEVPKPLIVDVEVTHVVTATPRPAPTRAPSATPAPTREVVVPEGWVKYDDIVDRLSLWHPAGWPVEEQGIGSVYFDLPNYAGVSFTELNTPVEVGTDVSVKNVVTQIVEGQDRLDTVKFVSSGTVDYGLQCDMCELGVQDYVYDSWSHEITLVCSRGQLNRIFVKVYRVSGDVKESELQDISTVLGSINPQ